MTEGTAALDVLIVEDSETDTKLVVRELRSSGFSPDWERVQSAGALRAALLRKTWQIVISDSSVPQLGALQALAITKELAPDVPFIVVSGTITEELAVEVMRRGAADYLNKAHLRRLGPAVTRELSGAQLRAGLSHRLLVAQEAELMRIARALHDQFGQLLTALKFTLDAVRGPQGLASEEALAEAHALVDEAMVQARDFSVELWPTILDDLGLAPALRALAERHARWSGLAVHVDQDPAPRLPAAVEVACFRIAQEALTNVARHAGARTVEIRLRVSPETIELIVSDDGHGFDVAEARARAGAEGSLGLVGMQHRASLAGGRLAIDSAPGSGTTVRARFDLSGSETP